MKSVVALLLSIPLLAACSSSTSAGSGACTNIGGTWTVTGACGPDTCVITQQSCSTDFQCSTGSASYAGSIDGNSVSYAGKDPTGTDATCSGTVGGNGTTMSGTCTAGGQTCSFAAAKQ